MATVLSTKISGLNARRLLSRRFTKRCPERMLCQSWNSEKIPKVSGMGSAGLDYLAVVSKFPRPDQKIRTESFEVQGGGNCANALTGVAKLGLKPFIITKVGDDSIGRQTISQLNEEGIDTDCVVVAEDRPSGFTYILVDRSGDTRTCIHTPADPLNPSELSTETIDRFLEDTSLVYFDGRLTEAAIEVAVRARERKIPVLVEAERLRPNLEMLIEKADIIVTSKNFPMDFSGEEYLGDALLAMAYRFQNAQTMITTLGSRGSIGLEIVRQSRREDWGSQQAILQDAIEMCWDTIDKTDAGTSDPDCFSNNGIPVWCGQSKQLEDMMPSMKRSPDIDEEVRERARKAAIDAAAADARPDDHRFYGIDRNAIRPLTLDLTVASAAHISKESIVDTTGAGDAFIAAVVYGIIHNMSSDEQLRFAGMIAACKCTQIGARSGQPTLENLKAYSSLKV